MCHENILFYDRLRHKFSKEKNFVHINFFFLHVQLLSYIINIHN